MWGGEDGQEVGPGAFVPRKTNPLYSACPIGKADLGQEGPVAIRQGDRVGPWLPEEGAGKSDH